MLRGMLLFPLWVVYLRLDTQGTEAQLGGRGYHPGFREPRVTTQNAGTALAKLTPTTTYFPPILLRAQVGQQANRLRMTPSGNAPDQRMRLILHFRDLERDQLVTPEGDPLLRVGDKVLGTHAAKGAATRVLAQQQSVKDPPGQFVEEVNVRGEGLGGHRNLLELVLGDRERGRLG